MLCGPHVRRLRRGDVVAATDTKMRATRLHGLLVLVAMAGLGTARPASAVDVQGPATALAGDVVRIGGKEIALYGASAPQPQQRCFDNALPWWCGKNSQEGLARLVKGKEVRCLDKGRDAEGRMLGLCRVGTVDLAESQISNGLAVADGTRGSAYLAAERTARQNQTGLWHGNPSGRFAP